MNLWRRMQRWRWWWRWPAKAAAFAVVVVITLYPKLWLLPTWIVRLGDMNAALEPAHPGLAPLAEAVRARVPGEADTRAVLAAVQAVVCERIPYAWDWDVWGVVDYLPTTAEVLERDREDCDGRAVLAAALLRRLGYDAWLVSDIQHTWVATPQGETMSPGVGERTIQAGPQGTAVRISLGALANLWRGVTFGVAVFPLPRELIILAALCALTMQPYSSIRRRVLGCLVLLAALALLRGAGRSDGTAVHRTALTWLGLGVAIAGWLLLAIKAGGRRWPSARPGSPATGGGGRD